MVHDTGLYECTMLGDAKKLKSFKWWEDQHTLILRALHSKKVEKGHLQHIQTQDERGNRLYSLRFMGYLQSFIKG